MSSLGKELMALLLLMLSFVRPSFCLVSPLAVVRDLFTAARPPDHAISSLKKPSGQQLLKRAGYEVLREVRLERDVSKRAIVAEGSSDAWFKLCEREFEIAFPSVVDLKERERKDFSGESRVEFFSASKQHLLVALFLSDLDDLPDEHRFLEEYGALCAELASTRDRLKSSKKGEHVVGAVFLPRVLGFEEDELSRMWDLPDFFDEHELFVFIGADLFIEAVIADIEAETAELHAELATAKRINDEKDVAIAAKDAKLRAIANLVANTENADMRAKLQEALGADTTTTTNDGD